MLIFLLKNFKLQESGQKKFIPFIYAQIHTFDCITTGSFGQGARYCAAMDWYGLRIAPAKMVYTVSSGSTHNFYSEGWTIPQKKNKQNLNRYQFG